MPPLTRCYVTHFLECKLPCLPNVLLDWKRIVSLDLSGASHLQHLPGLDVLSRLQYLSLRGCARLVAPLQLPANLSVLNMNGCLRALTFPEVKAPSKLRVLDLRCCIGAPYYI